ncbi:hypothetical protein PINS_up011942 [Pythium insidiosum]|nr:hypothetical protein PINS_up011942 [Pythium insidiosum]
MHSLGGLVCASGPVNHSIHHDRSETQSVVEHSLVDRVKPVPLVLNVVPHTAGVWHELSTHHQPLHRWIAVCPGNRDRRIGVLA